MTTDLLVERADGVLTVTLHRPGQLNALSRRLQEELVDLWVRVADDPSVRCVVVTGAGRAFSAGADTSELAVLTGPASRDGARGLAYCPGSWIPVPVVLAVNGLCLGGALRFVADADVVIAAEDAWFSDPHVSYGQTSGPLAVELAGRTAPAAIAPLVLAGRQFRLPAERALALGLVSEVVPSSRVLARAREVADMIAAQSPTAVRTTVAILRRMARESVQAHLDDAWSAMADQRNHADATEGPAAVAEGRSPRWAEPRTPATTEEATPLDRKDVRP